MDVQLVIATTIPHFKGLDLKNLQYGIRICQKHNTKVTITILIVYSFF